MRENLKRVARMSTRQPSIHRMKRVWENKLNASEPTRLLRRQTQQHVQQLKDASKQNLLRSLAMHICCDVLWRFQSTATRGESTAAFWRS